MRAWVDKWAEVEGKKVVLVTVSRLVGNYRQSLAALTTQCRAAAPLFRSRQIRELRNCCRSQLTPQRPLPRQLFQQVSRGAVRCTGGIWDVGQRKSGSVCAACTLWQGGLMARVMAS
jgi:hypothetical protein